MNYKVLVADPISDDGLHQLHEDDAFEVVHKTGLTENELVDIINDYDALIVRSQTQVTAKILKSATNLKVVARAGVGVDNIDIDTATKEGIVVINAPDGNTISATEHSVAMLLSMSRNIPQAHASLKNGEWDRKTFRGTELYQKTLGVIGTGRIGIGVAKRMQSFGMQILAFDPYLTESQANELGFKRASVEEIAQSADFVTVHTPLTEKTRGLVNDDFFNLAKPNLRIINVARGGIIDEAALIRALDEDKIAGAALDVFENEPAVGTPVTQHPKIIVTPHLGASTIEAQEKVALSVAEEIIEILKYQKVSHAVNAPKVIFDHSEDIQPFVELAQTTGELAIQLLPKAPRTMNITYSGDLALDDTSLLTRTLAKGVLQEDMGDHVNLINALMLLNEQNVSYTIEKTKGVQGFSNYIEVELINKEDRAKIGMTVLSGFGPRIVRIDDYAVDFKPERYQLFVQHTDQPGMIGRTGQILGEHDINIASMYVGRKQIGGRAMMILSIDHPINSDVHQALLGIPGIKSIQLVTLNE
ncbi:MULTISPECIES: phosphoglycerate dehydrogenase [unclassified Staphylococcus]|uniref:phosphoglycerate dehydrogenase n=1 Tax=unclassified Staphylococcus TaxID=91994 RepID=UPI0021D295D0|nr:MULTISPECIES: phosphoglycerate dehydrogenase [unclassified Staphylococcus]UXR68856.1 phosphoglycerate dehydrogenase [Staphylococcus sp. IVB6246]UXR70913.1 phosphoglycerate dehydrogenase [Staphylococcus sp. IVB6240]UXR73143.1 phosphoglycerate dehydrogenase [Staphylococcus sp. IVB6238]UXR75439.1 phosphoglycerate dehydrogenase [Staphylococcus sp. IVB6233]UXR79642.1 phosphoglycerate dehydrogenase [Staphylococcus sp. IVB6218]